MSACQTRYAAATASKKKSALKRALPLCCLLVPSAFAANILFVGNSFTFAAATPIMTYRANTVTDLNGNGTGGVPALFKSFAVQAGLDYKVSLETYPGVGIDWHLEHALDRIGGQRWDTVVLQSYSTLDNAHRAIRRRWCTRSNAWRKY